MGGYDINTLYTNTDNARKKQSVFIYFTWKWRQDHIWRMLCWTATFWGHRSWFWLNFWHTRINSGRFTSSEIHECPASLSFPTTLNNVMHNIEFLPVSLSQCSLSNTTHARSLYSQELLTQSPFTKRHRDAQRKYFINKCTQTAGQEPAETITHQKNPKKSATSKTF